jgi:transcriptional regulator with XRE-family HTH domain
MPTTTDLPFSGALLYRARKRAGLSQREVAERCEQAGVEVSQSYISLLEQGRHMPSVHLLAALAPAVRATIDDLLAEPSERAS